MKKVLAIVLTLVLMVSIVSCGENAAKVDVENTENIVETDKTQEVEVNEETKQDSSEEKSDVKEQVKQPNPEKNEQKPQEKPQEQKPAEKPQEQEPVKEPEQAPSTLGKILLADFKQKASSGMSAQAIADALITNSAIKFAGGVMPVEEGMLSGFDNAEITGFKSGMMFAPMIGSIPFIGYIFELNNAADASSFVSNLEKNANLRWNICVTADEMVTGVSGNKVFFVMCPTSLEE